MARRSRFGRKRLAGLLACALMASTLLATAPARAGDLTTKSFTSKRFTVEHRGSTYSVQVIVNKNGESANLNVSVSQSQSGDGNTSERSVNYSHSTTFSVNDNLSAGKLNPGDSEMGGFGDIDLEWDATKPLQKSCNQHSRSRKGVFAGTFTFKTGERRIGTIEKSNLSGTMRAHDGKCEREGERACPRAGIELGYSAPGSIVSGSKGSGKGKLFGLATKTLTDGWFRTQFVNATVPASHVTLNATESEGKLEGAPGTYFSGQSDFSSSFDSNEGEKEDCKGGREYYRQSNSGSLSKGFTIDFLVGDDTVLEGSASAVRTFVQDER